MTDQLTQEEAERCAEALGWKSLSEAISAGWFKAPEDEDDYYSDSYFYQKEERILEVPELSRDPYFWFPRLWERRKELEPVVRVGLWPNNSLAGDCIDFCAAIELLTVAK